MTPVPTDVHVFTDGSTKRNGRKDAVGGIGVFFSDDNVLNYSEGLTFDTFQQRVTNNLAELYAIQKALDILETHMDLNKTHVRLYTDSEYAYKICTVWAKSWEKNNWTKWDKKPIANLERIQDIYRRIGTKQITFHHCLSHQAPPPREEKRKYFIWYGNAQADLLATSAANL